MWTLLCVMTGRGTAASGQRKRIASRFHASTFPYLQFSKWATDIAVNSDSLKPLKGEFLRPVNLIKGAQRGHGKMFESQLIAVICW